MKHFKKSKGNTLFVFMTVLFIAVSLFTACGSDRKPKNVQKFTITYESEFAEAPHPVSLTKDTALTAEQLPELSYAGYEFLGWYVTGGTEEAPEETKIEAGFALTQNITLKAKWQKLSYFIIYISEKGNYSKTVTVEANTVLDDTYLAAPDVVVEGYDFDGWYITGGTEEAPVETKVTPGSVTVGQEGVTLNAKWAIKTFTVKYVTDFGEAPQSFVVDWNTALETSQLPIIRGIKGATFEGWYIGNELIKAGKKVTDNITLTAKWTIEGAPVVYVTEHGENKPKGLVVTAGYVLTADDLPELTEEGWIFNGWYIGAKLAKPGEITVGEEGVTLEAEWEAVKCTITYVSTLGTAPTNKKVNWGTLLSTGNELQPISAEGNEFMGWVYNDAVLENGYKITGDMTVTAKWEIKKYQISYSTEFGTAPEPITLEYGTKLLSENLPELTDEGWNFKGWYIINGTEETKPEAGVYAVKESVTLTAKWECKTNGLDVNVNIGSDSSDISIYYNYEWIDVENDDDYYLYTFTATEGFASYKWRLDGKTLANETSSELILSGLDYPTGQYKITVVGFDSEGKAVSISTDFYFYH